ncbi:DUF4249 domain-containing protein [Chitinophagaceae bacterium LWZ2-11]
MKKLLILISITAAAFTSCTKVINVDLKNAPPQLVIEGIVNNAIPAVVTLTQSVKFSSDNVFPTVSGANVTIQDNGGTIYTLTETSPGNYTNTSLIGASGHSYTMKVITGGVTYTAVSVMPAQVNFDTLLTDKITFGDKTINVVKPQYKDPPAPGNNYQFVEYQNGNRLDVVYTWNDNINNGGTSNRPLIYSEDKKPDIVKGDVIKVEMRCIDANVYVYMRGLADLNSQQTTPANPTSNISNGALGYFSAHTSQTRSVVIP